MKFVDIALIEYESNAEFVLLTTEGDERPLINKGQFIDKINMRVEVLNISNSKLSSKQVHKSKKTGRCYFRANVFSGYSKVVRQYLDEFKMGGYQEAQDKLVDGIVEQLTGEKGC